MKFRGIPCAALAAVLGLPMAARAAQGASADASAQVNAAVSDRYLTPVDAELTSKLDSKNAAVGQEVIRADQGHREAGRRHHAAAGNQAGGPCDRGAGA